MIKKDIDWEQVRREWAEGASFRDLGAKYDVNFTWISRKAKAEGWDRDKDAIRNKIATQQARARERAHTHAEIGETRAGVLQQTEAAALKLAGILDRTCNYLAGRTDEELLGALKYMASLSQAMKNNGDQLMTLYGLMDPYRKRQIDIAQAKLDMEKADRDAETHKEPRTIRIEDMEEMATDGNGDVPPE